MKNPTSSVFMFLSISNLLLAQGLPMRVEKIPKEFKLVQNIDEDIFYWKNDLSWPSDEDIKAREVPLTDPATQYPVRSTIEWLKTILKTEWVPGESHADIFALRSGKQGKDIVRYDSVRLRYRAGDYVIQISSDSRDIILVVGPYEISNNVDGKVEKESALKFISETVDKFLNESDKILKSDWKIKNKNTGVEGVIADFPGIWWQGIRWWTNGRTVLFSIPKMDPNNPRIPHSEADWFSSQSKETKPKRLVTKPKH